MSAVMIVAKIHILFHLGNIGTRFLPASHCLLILQFGYET